MADYYREDKNGISLVSLSGSWEEMGRQYGELYRRELHTIYHALLLPSAKGTEEGYARMVALSMGKYRDYPARFRSFFRGMAETSGLSEEQLIVCNAMETVYTVEEEPKCSTLAVWGDYAADKLLFGRNYDYNEIFRAFKDYVSLCVYHPADGSVPTATVGYVGEIYCANGLNRNGIFLALNNASKSSAEKHPGRLISLAQLLQLELDAPDMDYVHAFFRTVKCSSAYIVGVADKNEARIYEWCGLGMRWVECPRPGVQAATNHFVSPRWDLPTPDDASSWQSLTRRANLLSQAERYKGTIDPERMEQIMSLPIEDGGVLFHYSVYQLVAVPEELKLYIRVIDGADWTEFDLSEVF